MTTDNRRIVKTNTNLAVESLMSPFLEHGVEKTNRVVQWTGFGNGDFDFTFLDRTLLVIRENLHLLFIPELRLT